MFSITLRCRGGHEQTVTLGTVDRAEAVLMAGLLSGRSPMYVIPVPEDLPIEDRGLVGWCHECRERIEEPIVSEVDGAGKFG